MINAVGSGFSSPLIGLLRPLFFLTLLRLRAEGRALILPLLNDNVRTGSAVTRVTNALEIACHGSGEYTHSSAVEIATTSRARWRSVKGAFLSNQRVK